MGHTFDWPATNIVYFGGYPLRSGQLAWSGHPIRPVGQFRRSDP